MWKERENGQKEYQTKVKKSKDWENIKAWFKEWSESFLGRVQTVGKGTYDD
jgi:hypothetical protein